MTTSGLSDASSDGGLLPGAWEVQPGLSSSEVRLRSRLGRPFKLRLMPPSGEVFVDFVAGTPAPGWLRIPLMLDVPQAAKRDRSRLLEDLFDALRYPMAGLRLYEAAPDGSGHWRAGALLTIAGICDRVPPLVTCDSKTDTGQFLLVEVRFRLSEFGIDGRARGIGGQAYLRLRLALSVCAP